MLGLGSQLLCVCFILLNLATHSFGATLPSGEVQALRDIGKALGKTWDVNFVDACMMTWSDAANNNITCSSFNGTVYHVTGISLKSQNLPGTLPREIINLPYLKFIDLSRNYLNGSIPPEWGSMQKLEQIMLNGNRLTGRIPKEIGNMSSLSSLVIEANQLSGELPPELGNLSNLQRLHLTYNYFTGALPDTLGKLTKLRQFRISDNQFTGKIPDFIKNWTNLEELLIQASGLQGPIPSAVGFLRNLSDLRITDLNGPAANFPNLSSTEMKTLILRSCNLTGPLPDLSIMTTLKVLDVSFNQLTGNIPRTYMELDFVYLTGNLLSGAIPDWINEAKSLDLSYNNFTSENTDCQVKSVNLFASSSTLIDSGNVSCLASNPCPKNSPFLHINCGGSQVTVGPTTYDDDGTQQQSSMFYRNSAYNWAYSSTGHFMDNKNEIYKYIARNMSKLSMDNPQLYMTARRSPISLTYYGFCLVNGNYTVSLHFAEIMFSSDNTYSSLGRRIFDVYIQRKLVLKDFNIEEEADGVGKPIIKTFNATVNNNTLEIRFHWAGRGTCTLPEKGVYGPLISAISAVNPDFKSNSGSKISTVILVGIVAGVVVLGSLIATILWFNGCLGRKHREDLNLQKGSFSLSQIKAATGNFDAANKIGEGGFGSVYKGILSNGTVVAVKQLSSKSKQGNREFLNEIGMISALRHPHLVKLYGFCVEEDQLLLVYEYLENNSLARALFGPTELQLSLDWPLRRTICIGVARGLAYLHEGSMLKIVHRDIKATNVLLDKNLTPKISDFGLAKLDEEDNTHITTRIAGTYGYMAPEYALHGYLTEKADVYSFGVVALEIVSGRSNISHRQKGECLYLLDWAHVLKERGNLMDLVDPRLGSNFKIDEVMVMIHVALLCTCVSASARPSMSLVVSMLEGNEPVPSLIPERNITADAKKIEALRRHFMGSEEEEPKESLVVESVATSLPLTASSASDLYPISWISYNLENRE